MTSGSGTWHSCLNDGKIVKKIYNAPAKRSQHATQHVATLLGATCWVRLATLLRHVGCCWLKFDQFQTWASNSQHVATCRNKLAKRTQQVAPNNVAIVWPGLYRFFLQFCHRWGSYVKSQIPTSYFRNYLWWQVIRSYVKWDMASFRCYGNSEFGGMYPIWEF